MFLMVLLMLVPCFTTTRFSINCIWCFTSILFESILTYVYIAGSIMMEEEHHKALGINKKKGWFCPPFLLENMKNIKSYLITDPNYFSNNPEKFEEKLIAVLKNHKIDFACFRDKSSQNIEELDKIFLQICKEFKIENILINSNISLAIKLGFDGVHLNSQQFDKIENQKNKTYHNYILS